MILNWYKHSSTSAYSQVGKSTHHQISKSAHQSMIDAYELAHKRIVRKKWFYQHLSIALGVLLFLFLLNLLQFFNMWDYRPGMGKSEILRDILRYPFWWFPYATLSWSLALFIHYCFAFGIPFLGQFDEKWQAEAIEAEMKRIQNKASQLPKMKKAGDQSLHLKTLQKEAQVNEQWTDSELL